jgi:hypothetical protein
MRKIPAKEEKGILAFQHTGNHFTDWAILAHKDTMCLILIYKVQELPECELNPSNVKV